MTVTPSQYAAGQAAITAVTLNYALSLGRYVTKPVLSLLEWMRLLQLVYSNVEQQRSKAAALARDFYDTQRSLHVPDLAPNSVDLVGTNFEIFVRNMEPARREMSRENSPRTALSTFALRSVREVENAARSQVVKAVKEDEQLAQIIEADFDQKLGPDPPPKMEDHKGREFPRRAELVQGWARVATGEETCAWCLMLISRGPVYRGADRAGLDLDDLEALDMIAAGEDISDSMDEWHTGCDCKVVPVFRLDDWTGKEAAAKAEQLWIDASREARKLIESGEARTDNQNTETQNVIRRWFYHGEINPNDYAGLSAA